ncbi:MAG TPA: hypothetical protein VIH42_14835, partial [Thermoguttaceae bacterium]
PVWHQESDAYQQRNRNEDLPVNSLPTYQGDNRSIAGHDYVRASARVRSSQVLGSRKSLH